RPVDRLRETPRRQPRPHHRREGPREVPENLAENRDRNRQRRLRDGKRIRMAEVSFHSEIKSLTLGKGDTFRGEGILGVTKALLQSGVAYVGGYQGAPVSHLLDVLVQSEDLLSELGVHLETCT